MTVVQSIDAVLTATSLIAFVCLVAVALTRHSEAAIPASRRWKMSENKTTFEAAPVGNVDPTTVLGRGGALRGPSVEETLLRDLLARLARLDAKVGAVMSGLDRRIDLANERIEALELADRGRQDDGR